MELNREQIVIEIGGLIKALKANNGWWENRGRGGWFNHDILVDALSLIKELTEENEAWQKQLISTEEKSSKAYYDLACEVEDLRAENEMLHASCTELTQKCASLTEENEKLTTMFIARAEDISRLSKEKEMLEGKDDNT